MGDSCEDSSWTVVEDADCFTTSEASAESMGGHASSLHGQNSQVVQATSNREASEEGSTAVFVAKEQLCNSTESQHRAAGNHDGSNADQSKVCEEAPSTLLEEEKNFVVTSTKPRTQKGSSSCEISEADAKEGHSWPEHTSASSMLSSSVSLPERGTGDEQEESSSFLDMDDETSSSDLETSLTTSLSVSSRSTQCGSLEVPISEHATGEIFFLNVAPGFSFCGRCLNSSVVVACWF